MLIKRTYHVLTTLHQISIDLLFNLCYGSYWVFVRDLSSLQQRVCCFSFFGTSTAL